MTALIPAGAMPATGLHSGAAVNPILARVRDFAGQPAVRTVLPWFAGVAALGLVALGWSALSTPPQRPLYSQLDDAERAGVAGTLDAAAIPYTIDNQTGALTVAEDDFYRAKMLVASDEALATPESGAQMLDSLPMGASRTLEGDRLRAAQERDLTLTIQEIDGVEGVRVHLARAERSVFVRDDVPPTASVMVRMSRGRQLAGPQVVAIANLVAGSVPGLSIDAVRIVDQHGRLLSQPAGANSDRFDLQTRIEAKLRTQVEQLLAPMIGAGNFSSEIQVELDMSEVTSARESYDKDGAVRRESVQSAQSAQPVAAGVPGVLSNTPPPAAQAVAGAPQGGPAQGATTGTGESSTTRSFELGREVAVSNIAPGSLKRLSVAVALNQNTLKGTKPQDLAKFKELITAAVGADSQRGDTVAVVVRPFQPAEIDAAPFWEAGWFATVLRNAVALIAVLLMVFLVLRPALKKLGKADRPATGEATQASAAIPDPDSDATPAAPFGRDQLAVQIELAQRIVREQPDDALSALRRMLNEPASGEDMAR